MKRSAALEPFSRDHNDGLILARALEGGSPLAIDQARAAWAAELSDHFKEEERLLIPLLDPTSARRLRAEHEAIEQRIVRLPDDPVGLGSTLAAHIRWEERELFPSIEKTATSSQMDGLKAATDLIERRRWLNDSKRERLVRRRGTLV